MAIRSRKYEPDFDHFDLGMRVTCDDVYVHHDSAMWAVQTAADRHAMAALDWTEIDDGDEYDHGILESVFQGRRYRIAKRRQRSE